MGIMPPELLEKRERGRGGGGGGEGGKMNSWDWEVDYPALLDAEIRKSMILQ